jgi:O-6-methylguanine DNA methyltransferase
MRIAYHVMSAPGPLGLLFLAGTERGLRYLEFLDKRSIKRAIESHRDANPEATWEASLVSLKPYVDQLEGYFCGAVTRFGLPLDPLGSEFELQVWKELDRIPYGETRTYGQVAKAIGQPKASRAVGLANNHNPIAIITPCHRVIGADGSLTGYGGGLPRKRWLLAHETHFGALRGETLDLFAAVGSMATGRVASGDGPPLGLQRARPTPALHSAEPAPAPRKTDAPRGRAKPALKAKPATRKSSRSAQAARASARSTARRVAAGRAKPKSAPRPRKKSAARSSRTSSRSLR